MSTPALTRRALLRSAGAVILGSVCATLLDTPAAQAAAGSSKFEPITPARLADTRNAVGAFGFTRLSPTIIRVQIAGRGGVPAGATAAVLNITATNTRPGYITVYPAGESLPTASNLNIETAGQTIANMATVKLGAGGSVDIYTYGSGDIIVDALGAYTPAAVAVAAGRFVAHPSGAVRVFDSRARNYRMQPGSTERIDVSGVVPADASAVVVILTAIDSDGYGYLTAYPSGEAQPSSSNVNTDSPGQTRAGQAIVKLNGPRAFNLFTSKPGGCHLAVDVAGWFTGPTSPVSGDGLFIPVTPYRAIDTRTNPTYGRMHPRWTCEFPTGSVAAVALNLTTTETRGAGYLTVYPARTVRPEASHLNASGPGQTIANHAITRVSTAGAAVYTWGGGQVIADISGYFTGAPAPATTVQASNEMPAAPHPPYTLSIPSIGLNAQVLEGVEDAIIDRGAIGHWPGTAYPGELAPMLLFGHRTEHGGPLLRSNELTGGQDMVITDQAGNTFRYRVVRRDITNPTVDSVLEAAARAGAGSVLTLVSCSKRNFMPTDTRYRIAVTAVLVT